MNILKSIGAVLAGMIFIVATHTITDKILESAIASARAETAAATKPR